MKYVVSKYGNVEYLEGSGKEMLNTNKHTSITMRYKEFCKRIPLDQKNLLKLWLQTYNREEIAERLGCKVVVLNGLLSRYKLASSKKEAVDVVEDSKGVSEVIPTTLPEEHISPLGITYEDFKEMSDDDRIRAYEEYKKVYMEREIAAIWRISPSVISNLIHQTRSRVARGIERDEKMKRPSRVTLLPQGEKYNMEKMTANTIFSHIRMMEEAALKASAEMQRLIKENEVLKESGSWEQKYNDLLKDVERLKDIEVKFNAIKSALF